MKKLLFSSILLGFGTLSMTAQSGTKSPYSQYGLGILADQSQAANRGMGGVSQGLRSGNQVNMQNPASYSAVDSLSMIVDAAVAGQITNFKEGGSRVNAKSANIEYVNALFRLFPKFGVSVGVVPYSNIGYNYITEEGIKNSSAKAAMSYLGSGGLHQAYLGLGYELFKGFSLGVNASYLWGDYERTVTVLSGEDSGNSLIKGYEADFSTYKLDFGAQYQAQLPKGSSLTVGATFGLGHKLGADAEMLIMSNQGSDTTTIVNAFSLPMTIGGGIAYNHRRSLTIAADYQLQRWSKVDYPGTDLTTGKYTLLKGIYSDRHRVMVGLDWLPTTDPLARGLLKHVHYRLGASYTTPYYKINGQDGPKEISVSAGFGIPLVNAWNNRSVLNVSFQWVNQSAKNLITENSFRVTVGLTFNERWFAKWKVD